MKGRINFHILLQNLGATPKPREQFQNPESINPSLAGEQCNQNYPYIYVSMVSIVDCGSRFYLFIILWS